MTLISLSDEGRWGEGRQTWRGAEGEIDVRRKREQLAAIPVRRYRAAVRGSSIHPALAAAAN